MGKLSYLSTKVWGMTELLDGSCSSMDELNIVVVVLADRFDFQPSFHFQD